MISKILSLFKNKGGAVITKNGKFTTDKDVSRDLDKEIREKCKVDGQALLDNFLAARSQEINQINDLFDSEGVLKSANSAMLSATTFNDLYKWTMMPVIRKLEETKGPITVTFGIDLRDPSMRQALKDSHQAGPASGLISEIHNALRSLETRQFNRRIFDMVLDGPRGHILTDADKDAICGPVGAPRTLVQVGGVKRYNDRPRVGDMSDESVSIYFYYREDKDYDGEPGVHFIEAVGPWHKVTWLETTMMQAVYEAKLRYDLRVNIKKPTYGEWLYSALLRCAKSICYTKEVCRRTGNNMLPALFAGRRTGGLQFTLLQHLLFADNFMQFAPAGAAPLPDSQCLRTELACLGTSSCDARFIMRQLGLPCHNVVGTHAHELSMVCQALFYRADLTKVPYSQVLSHYLYYLLTWKKTGGLMPMLPDTLGTRPFLLAARQLVMSDQTPFLNLITSARQDSGQLDAFIQNMKDFGYIGKPSPSTIMASEIDTTATLLEAAGLGYQFFGAGGFYGDSVKVWDDETISSNSMAVKAVRVSFTASSDMLSSVDVSPIINIHGNIVTGYPVKIGDTTPGDEGEPKKGKLSIDRNLGDEEIGAILSFALEIRGYAGSPLQVYVNDASKDVMYLNDMLATHGLGALLPQPALGGSYRKKQSRKQRHKRRVSRSRY